MRRVLSSIQSSTQDDKQSTLDMVKSGIRRPAFGTKAIEVSMMPAWKENIALAIICFHTASRSGKGKVKKRQKDNGLVQ